MTTSKVVVTVVGDKGVGKTSLITTAAQDCFSRHPPPVLPLTRFEPRFFENEPVELHVYDTCSDPHQDPATFETVVQAADVIVLCFDFQRRETLSNLRTHWLPKLCSLKPETPIILACCKAEADTPRDQEELREAVDALLQDYLQIEVCLRCSAARLLAVRDVFSFALKMVAYPVGPLFDKQEQSLRPLCIKALLRVFNMCDADQDGVLSDDELNSFQVRCFNQPLQREELQMLKDGVQAKMPSGIQDSGLTISGFIYLHSLFITRGRLESTWAVMRKFGYGDDLHLAPEFVDKVSLQAAADQSVELSDAAVAFLSRQFELHDGGNCGALGITDLDRMFSTAPVPLYQGEAWSRLLVAGPNTRTLSLSGFLAKWRYCAAVDARGALEQLLYLGYGPPTGASAQDLFVKVPRRRPEKKSDISARSTISALMIGPQGAGKSGLIKALAGRRYDEAAGGQTLVAAGTVQHSSGAKTLLLTEVAAEAAATELLTSPPTAGDDGAAAADFGSAAGGAPSLLSELERCDVALFVFDSSSLDSFQQAVRLLLAASTAAGPTLPCVLVAAKDDLGLSQELQQQCGKVAAELEIASPVTASAVNGTAAAVFLRAVEAAINSKGHVPDTPARKARRNTFKKVAVYTGIGVTSVGVVYLGWKLYQHLSSGDGGGEAAASGSVGQGSSRSLGFPVSGAYSSSSSSSGGGGGDGLVGLASLAFGR